MVRNELARTARRSIRKEAALVRFAVEDYTTVCRKFHVLFSNKKNKIWLRADYIVHFFSLRHGV